MHRMVKYVFAAILTLALTTLGAQTQNEVALTTPSGDLHGTLLDPDNATKPPVVLIIPGSGPTDRDGNQGALRNNSLKMLAEGLADKGIASLRYDKRTVSNNGITSADTKDLSFKHFVQDAQNWVNYLHDNHEYSEVAILGHSQGSLVGMIAAQHCAVSKLVSIAGSGIPAAHLLRRQFEQQPTAVMELMTPILDKLENGDTVGQVHPATWGIFHPDIQPFLISWFNFDPREEIAKLDIPVLIVQGTTDIQVGVDHADSLYQAYPKAVKSILEGMNHVLKPATLDRMENIKTYSNPDLHLYAGLVDVIGDFILTK